MGEGGLGKRLVSSKKSGGGLGKRLASSKKSGEVVFWAEIWCRARQLCHSE